jgi:hypothetical protein
MAECAEGLWSVQDALEALERDGRFRPDDEGVQIGVELGPPYGAGGRRSANRSSFWRQLRFVKRQLPLPVSTMSQWRVIRSSSAIVILGSPNTLGHSPNVRLVVMITEVCS